MWRLWPKKTDAVSKPQLVGKTAKPRALATRTAALLSAAAVPMRRAGLTAVVDVDPQSL